MGTTKNGTVGEGRCDLTPIVTINRRVGWGPIPRPSQMGRGFIG